MPHAAAIFGLAGPRLSAAESAFFQGVRPWGFILFQRNCETPAGVRALCAELKALTGRERLPILIDQEGGRITRLKPPAWRAPPAPAEFGRLFAQQPEAAREACYLNSRLIAAELAEAGITVNCLPCLDVPQPGAHDVIGDRAYGSDPHAVIELGRAAADGLLDGGIVPVMKHIPGHGRAKADSHLELPVVDAAQEELSRTDFVTFRSLNHLPAAMTAHVVYAAIDSARPATLSPRIIHTVIRGEMGYNGLLMTDDLGMKALTGSFAERAKHALIAGCDVVLHCSGDMAEMEDAARELKPLEGKPLERALAIEALVGEKSDGFQAPMALARIGELLKGTNAA